MPPTAKGADRHKAGAGLSINTLYYRAFRRRDGAEREQGDKLAHSFWPNYKVEAAVALSCIRAWRWEPDKGG